MGPDTTVVRNVDARTDTAAFVSLCREAAALIVGKVCAHCAAVTVVRPSHRNVHSPLYLSRSLFLLIDVLCCVQMSRALSPCAVRTRYAFVTHADASAAAGAVVRWRQAAGASLRRPSCLASRYSASLSCVHGLAGHDEDSRRPRRPPPSSLAPPFSARLPTACLVTRRRRRASIEIDRRPSTA
jgi:hypothetical protein